MTTNRVPISNFYYIQLLIISTCRDVSCAGHELRGGLLVFFFVSFGRCLSKNGRSSSSNDVHNNNNNHDVNQLSTSYRLLYIWRLDGRVAAPWGLTITIDNKLWSCEGGCPTENVFITYKSFVTACGVPVTGLWRSWWRRSGRLLCWRWWPAAGSRGPSRAGCVNIIFHRFRG